MAGVCVAFVCGFFLTASPWASVAFLWIGFDGWLFGGLILLGLPAMCFSEGLCVFRLILLFTQSFMSSVTLVRLLL